MEDASGHFEEYINFDNRVSGFRLHFRGLNSNQSLQFTRCHLPVIGIRRAPSYVHHNQPLVPPLEPSYGNSGECGLVLARPNNAEIENCGGSLCRAQIFGFITDFHSSQLNRGIRDLIDASPTIQYRIELFAASIIDDSRESPFVVADRRALLERYHTRWDRLQGDKWRRVVLPAHTKRVLEGDVLGCVTETRGGKLDVHFIQLPSLSREVRLKRWIIRGLPKCDVALKINPGADLLVVPEVVNEGRYVV